jgi:hypothetical protein
MHSLKTIKYIRDHSISLAIVSVLLLGLFSQPTLASDDNKDNKSSGDVPVRMVVTVKPHHGEQVPAVGVHDVKVFQRDQQNAVTSWVPLQGDRAGLQLFILIDDTSRTSLGLQLNSIAKFIEEQPASTSIGVGYMRNGTVEVMQNLTTDRAAATKALRLPHGGVGYTSPYLSLSDLMKKWPVSQDRREVLMITSGIDPLGGGASNDPFTNPYLQQAVDRAQKGGFIVYSIYMPGTGRAGRGFFRTNLAQTGLDILAQKTGGETYYLGLGSPVDITPYLRSVSFSLRNQYELTFLAKGGKKPALQPVKVKTEAPNIGLIAAQDGYVGTGM